MEQNEQLSLDEVLARFREEAQGNLSALGAAFEMLVKSILLNAPVYRGHFKRVWLWGELNQGHDTGIDLVAEDKVGKLYGIQAKCYDPRYRVSKEDINTFLARLGNSILFEGAQRNFAHGMIFASTDNWTDHAEETLTNWKIPVQIVSRAQMDSWSVNWAVLAGFASGSTIDRKDLRDYQKEALANAATYFSTHDRGQLIMACGTGKTFTALRLWEQESGGKGLALFLVPSIALLNQSLLAWADDATFPFHAVCVCSDANAHRRASDDTSSNALVLPPTTSAKEIARRIRYYREQYPNDPIVVFSTYQSIEMVEQAQRELGREAFVFDFAICDEAHRTTGAIAKEEKEPAFVRIHDNANLLARKRLYMTATPRLYGKQVREKAETRAIELCDMNDVSLYGEVFFEISFGEAVARGYLTDYKVLVLTLEENAFRGAELYDTLTTDEKKALESRYDDGRTTAVKILGSINALSKRLKDSPILNRYDAIPAHRAVAFCRTIEASKATARLFEAFAEDPRFNEALRVKSRHVDGAMSALERGDALNWIKRDAGSNVCNLLCNVRCLSEGVDVPSMDAVIFMARRKSMVEVAQSVGRVMRRAPGKQYGYVILPVIIPAGSSAEEELDRDENYKLIWKVLNALRAHDRRFEAIVNQLRFDHGSINATDPTGTETAATGIPSILISNGMSEDDYASLSVHEPGPDGEMVQDTLSLAFPENMARFRDLLYARVVEKCGNRKYFERWAADVGQIAAHHVARLKALCETDPKARDAFQRFHALLQTAACSTITEDDARVMLAQQRLTGPIFDALFGNNAFTAHNPISEALDHATALLAALETDEERKKLGHFYQDVRDRVSGIRSADGKLEIIRTLYDTFFASAFAATAKKLGIVFTPIEVVDFILRSADDALKKYFGKSLSDEGVHILDPFTGTGTFIARLLQKDIDLIRDKDLERKYLHELHANEIVLLSYYIAAVNIENVFHDRATRTDDYTPFPGIVLGDTFRMREFSAQPTFDEPGFQENSERIRTQNNAPISVIVGNPPYSVGQKSANDNAQNEKYPWLNERIEETYAAQSTATLKTSLYDSYMKAFRWASDVIANERGGIVGYITNNGWIDSNSGAGFRKCIVEEFDEIYCYNLRGNIRAFNKAEGGNIFNVMVGTAILLLVRLPKKQHHGNATVHYRDIEPYISAVDKLNRIDVTNNFFNPTWLDGSTEITPNEHGDWLNQRDDRFGAFLPLAPDRRIDETSHSFFTYGSNGCKTQRDAWCYNFSRETIVASMEKCIATYNRVRETKQPCEDKIQISWTRGLRQILGRNKKLDINLTACRPALYRPFFRECLYFDKAWNELQGVAPLAFPTGERGENVVIAVSGVGVTKSFSCIITDITPDLELIGKSQCFPLYWYEEKDVDLFGKRELVRHDGVSDWIAELARRAYGETVVKEDIFYYVYGYLHKRDYRENFAADLKKSLPKIPLVERYEDFRKISEIGRALAQLHLHYETLDPYPLEEIGDFSNTRVEKMKFGGKGGKDRTRLVVNGTLTLAGIPPEAFDYVVNGRSPLEWAVDRYQVRTDKASGIVNDPNHWAPENPRYIPNLCKRLVTLSLESLRLIARLP